MIQCSKTNAIKNSWNCYHADVDQPKMEAIMDKMTQKNRSVGGQPTSYLDLGYDNVGLVGELLTETPARVVSHSHWLAGR